MSEVVRRASINWIGRLTNSSTTSPSFNGPYESGHFIVPTGAESTTVTFYVLNPASGAWVQQYTAANVALSMTVAQTRAYPLPTEMKAARKWRIVTGADDDDVDWVVSYVQ